MNCKKTSMLMSAALDGELDAREKEQFESHCAACAGCGAKYLRLSRTDSLFASLPPGEASPFFETRFYERLAGRDTGSMPEFIGIEKKLLMGFAAVMLIISAVTFKSFNTAAAQEYAELSSYIAGSPSNASNTGLLDKEQIEVDDIVSYMSGGSI